MPPLETLPITTTTRAIATTTTPCTIISTEGAAEAAATTTTTTTNKEEKRFPSQFTVKKEGNHSTTKSNMNDEYHALPKNFFDRPDGPLGGSTSSYLQSPRRTKMRASWVAGTDGQPTTETSQDHVVQTDDGKDSAATHRTTTSTSSTKTTSTNQNGGTLSELSETRGRQNNRRKVHRQRSRSLSDMNKLRRPKDPMDLPDNFSERPTGFLGESRPSYLQQPRRKLRASWLGEATTTNNNNNNNNNNNSHEIGSPTVEKDSASSKPSEARAVSGTIMKVEQEIIQANEEPKLSKTGNTDFDRNNTRKGPPKEESKPTPEPKAHHGGGRQNQNARRVQRQRSRSLSDMKRFRHSDLPTNFSDRPDGYLGESTPSYLQKPHRKLRASWIGGPTENKDVTQSNSSGSLLKRSSTEKASEPVDSGSNTGTAAPKTTKNVTSTINNKNELPASAMPPAVQPRRREPRKVQRQRSSSLSDMNRGHSRLPDNFSDRPAGFLGESCPSYLQKPRQKLRASWIDGPTNHEDEVEAPTASPCSSDNERKTVTDAMPKEKVKGAKSQTSNFENNDGPAAAAATAPLQQKRKELRKVHRQRSSSLSDMKRLLGESREEPGSGYLLNARRKLRPSILLADTSQGDKIGQRNIEDSNLVINKSEKNSATAGKTADAATTAGADENGARKTTRSRSGSKNDASATSSPEQSKLPKLRKIQRQRSSSLSDMNRCLHNLPNNLSDQPLNILGESNSSLLQTARRKLRPSCIGEATNNNNSKEHPGLDSSVERNQVRSKPNTRAVVAGASGLEEHQTAKTPKTNMARSSDGSGTSSDSLEQPKEASKQQHGQQEHRVQRQRSSSLSDMRGFNPSDPPTNFSDRPDGFLGDSAPCYLQKPHRKLRASWIGGGISDGDQVQSKEDAAAPVLSTSTCDRIVAPKQRGEEVPPKKTRPTVKENRNGASGDVALGIQSKQNISEQIKRRGDQEFDRKMDRQRSNSLWDIHDHRSGGEELPGEGAFTSLRQKYLEAMKNSNQKGIFSRAEQTEVGHIEDEILTTAAVPPSRGVPRTRSRSLTQLDQRKGGVRRAEKRPTNDVEKEQAKANGNGSSTMPSRGRTLQRTKMRSRSRSLTARDQNGAKSAESASVRKPFGASGKRTPKRTRSRSLTSIRKETAEDGTTKSYLEYTNPDKWKSLKERSATKIQAVARGFLRRMQWILRKPALHKQKIEREKWRDIIKIQQRKKDTMRDIKFELEDEEYAREKRVKEMLKERVKLEKQVDGEKETKQALRNEIRKEKEETERLKKHKETDSVVTLLHSSAVTGFHVEQAGAKKRLKAYKKEVASAKRELDEIQANWDAEKSLKRKLERCMKAIVLKVRESSSADETLINHITKYTGVDV